MSFTAQESGLVYLGVAATATQSGTANLTVAVATNDGNPTSPVPIIPGIPQTFHLGAANGGNSSSYYTFTPTESGSHLVDLDSSVATYTATLYSGSFGGTVELTATGSASGLVNLGTLTANTTYYLVLQNTSNAAYSSAGGSLAVPRVLPVGAPYTAGLVKVPRQSVWYVVPVTGGSTCLLNWDDSYQGSTTYSLDTEVSAYQANMTAYFTNRDTGYLSGSTPPVAVPLDQSSVFVKVRAFSAGPATGTFAIKATAQQPPAALAISIGTAQVGSPLSLVGSGTTGATSYAWTITTKPASSVAVISQATSANASFTPDVAGNYSFQLAATNSAGTSTSPVAVTVAPQPVPVASATYTGAPAIGSQFTLNGSGTTGASTYVWTITAKPSGSVTAIVSATYANAYFTPDAVGDYTFLLTVSNAAGSSTANLTVTVAPPPAPVARATSVASGQVGTPITLSGSGTTGASSYTWTVTSRPIGSTASLGSPTSATATLTPDLPGDYTFQLAATNLGGTSTATVSVTVTGGILSITVN